MLLAPIIGGVYGILHDQLTYSISTEYYTKYKFYQFGLMNEGNEALIAHPRMGVSAVGFMATWWVGLPIGVVLALLGLRHSDYKRMFKVSMKAMIITLIVAFATGLLGLAYGKWYLASAGVGWSMPESLADPENFIALGSMHNFSYVGGLFENI